jgi:hypothetical protein
MNSSSESDPTYVLGRSEGETSRLQRQAELLKHPTRRLFEDAGITTSGRSVAVGVGAQLEHEATDDRDHGGHDLTRLRIGYRSCRLTGRGRSGQAAAGAASGTASPNLGKYRCGPAQSRLIPSVNAQAASVVLALVRQIDLGL